MMLQVQNNPLKSASELGSLRNCISLIKVQTSFKSVPCNCNIIATSSNKSLPLQHNSYASQSYKLSSDLRRTKCNSKSTLPVEVGTAVEMISRDLISSNCKASSSASLLEVQHSVQILFSVIFCTWICLFI